jgi:hypothetical protein
VLESCNAVLATRHGLGCAQLTGEPFGPGVTAVRLPW